MRAEIQNKILGICQNGTFAQMEYNKTTKAVSKVVPEELLTPKVVVNETSSVPSQSVVHGARTGDIGLSNWRFEAHLKFTSEVDTYVFLTTQLKPISFVHGNVRIRVGSIGSPVVHPPRQGSHNGTEILITFSVNTRR